MSFKDKDIQFIVLVEFFNGDIIEAEAFKNIDSFREYFIETIFSDSQNNQDNFTKQLNEQLKYEGKTTINIYVSEYNIKAFISYPLF